MFISDAWGLPLLKSMQDVQTAFDSMSHDLIYSAMIGRGASYNDVGLHMRELTGMRGQISLPHVGGTKLFNFTRGGKQGGIETPDQWRVVIDHLLEPVVHKWGAQGFGFKLVDDDGDAEQLVNHAIWADNVVLFATSYKMMQQMIDDLDKALGSQLMQSGGRFFNWKPSSLESKYCVWSIGNI